MVSRPDSQQARIKHCTDRMVSFIRSSGEHFAEMFENTAASGQLEDDMMWFIHDTNPYVEGAIIASLTFCPLSDIQSVVGPDLVVPEAMKAQLRAHLVPGRFPVLYRGEKLLLAGSVGDAGSWINASGGNG